MSPDNAAWAERVELQRAGLCGQVDAGPPQERMQPCDELGEREWLGQVVVAAGAETADAVGERTAGGQEEDRCLDALCAERLAHVASVAVRKADVDDEDVRGSSLDLVEKLASGCRAPRRETFLREAA